MSYREEWRLTERDLELERDMERLEADNELERIQSYNKRYVVYDKANDKMLRYRNGNVILYSERDEAVKDLLHYDNANEVVMQFKDLSKENQLIIFHQNKTLTKKLERKEMVTELIIFNVLRNYANLTDLEVEKLWLKNKYKLILKTWV